MAFRHAETWHHVMASLPGSCSEVKLGFGGVQMRSSLIFGVGARHPLKAGNCFNELASVRPARPGSPIRPNFRPTSYGGIRPTCQRAQARSPPPPGVGAEGGHMGPNEISHAFLGGGQPPLKNRGFIQ